MPKKRFSGVEAAGRKFITISDDSRYEAHCQRIVNWRASESGEIDSLVNNPALQWAPAPRRGPSKESDRTFKTDVHAMC